MIGIAAKFLHRWLNHPRVYTRKMTFIPYIDSGHVPMHHFPTRRLRLELSFRLFALSPPQLLSREQPFISGFLSLRHGLHPPNWICSFSQARLGLRFLHNLSAGVESGFSHISPP